MRNRSKLIYVLLALLLAAGLYLVNRDKVAGTPATAQTQEMSIDALTKEATVVAYLKAHQQLPAYYIKKSQAREKGWDPASGNLCEAFPGHAIGGDFFGNREGRLPAKKGRKWYEADLDYNCGRRNARRVLFSSDGLIYVTYDHYETFQKR